MNVPATQGSPESQIKNLTQNKNKYYTAALITNNYLQADSSWS